MGRSLGREVFSNGKGVRKRRLGRSDVDPVFGIRRPDPFGRGNTIRRRFGNPLLRGRGPSFPVRRSRDNRTEENRRHGPKNRDSRDARRRGDDRESPPRRDIGSEGLVGRIDRSPFSQKRSRSRQRHPLLRRYGNIRRRIRRIPEQRIIAPRRSERRERRGRRRRARDIRAAPAVFREGGVPPLRNLGIRVARGKRRSGSSRRAHVDGFDACGAGIQS